jgi:hypothetical protein
MNLTPEVIAEAHARAEHIRWAEQWLAAELAAQHEVGAAMRAQGWTYPRVTEATGLSKTALVNHAKRAGNHRAKGERG